MNDIQEIITAGVRAKELTAASLMVPAFEDAAVYAARGDWSNEARCIYNAQKSAASVAALRGPGWWAVARDKLISKGLIFVNSDWVGDVTLESGLEAIGRKQSIWAESKIQGKPIHIRTDRIVCDGEVGVLDAYTSASVFVDGTDQITQRPTLSRMALLAPLPGSALIPGLALQKKQINDFRDITFSVSGNGWHYAATISPAGLQAARLIAEKVNSLARSFSPTPSPNSPERQNLTNSPVRSSQDDLISKLEKLKALSDSGAITTEEFEMLKKAAFDS